MNNPSNFDELGRLVGSLCDGSIDDDDLQRLNRVLREDVAARAYYLDYFALHGVLAWELSPTADANDQQAIQQEVVSTADSTEGDGLAALIASLEDRRQPTSVVKAPTRLPVLSFLGTSINHGISIATAPRFSLLLLLGITVASIVGAFSATRLRRVETVEHITVSPMPPGEYVATLVGSTAGGVNLGTGASRAGARLLAGDMRLESGVAEIMFDSGARVVLQGPARFTPLSSRGGVLHYGRLVASIPPQSDTFAVQTPLLVVSGLRNEFAVRADNQGPSEVHVFRGTAAVATRRQHSNDVAQSELDAGEALRVEPDTSQAASVIHTLSAQPEGFVHNLPMRQVKFPSPLVAYWNFDEEGGPVFDQRGNSHGIVQGVKRVAGLIGRGALEFTNETGQLVNVGHDEATYRFTDGITIEAIVVTRWNGKYGSYREIFRKDDGNHRVLLSFQHDSQLEFAVPRVPQGPVLSFGANLGGIYQELDMPLDGNEGRPNLGDLTDGEPHHIVASYDARIGEKAIFIDGNFCFGTQVEPGTKLTTGGAQPACIGSLNGWETFDGVIDELAIYSKALSRDEVARHYKNVREHRSYFEINRPQATNDST